MFHLNKLLSSPPDDKNKTTVDEEMARNYYYSKLKTNLYSITNNHIKHKIHLIHFSNSNKIFLSLFKAAWMKLRWISLSTFHYFKFSKMQDYVYLCLGVLFGLVFGIAGNHCQFLRLLGKK